MIYRNSLKCLSNRCENNIRQNLEDIKVNPGDTGNRNLNQVLSYFLYNAPNIDSKMSVQLKKNKHDTLLSSMLDGRHFNFVKFIKSNIPIYDSLLEAKLEGCRICLKCKRMVLKYKRAKNGVLESDLECFLRHIRNAIAHGRVYYTKNKRSTFVIFEDMNNNNISARIVCILADLEHWRKVLTAAVREESKHGIIDS